MENSSPGFGHNREQRSLGSAREVRAGLSLTGLIHKVSKAVQNSCQDFFELRGKFQVVF